MSKKLTAIIPCFNEDHNIVNAIKSIDFADEIMIVDSFSEDKTIELATPLSDTILQRKYENSASQKNWAIPQAKNPWILLLDADERITPELKEEVQNIIKYGSDKSAFWIKRENYFMNKKIKYSGWQGDKVIRLFKRDECKYEEKNVHSEIIDNGNVGILKHKITHHTYVNRRSYLKKLERYAKWQAKDYDKKIKNVTFFHTLIKPSIRFIKHYIIQLGILDGYPGLIISLYQAKAVSMRYKYLKQYRKCSRK